MTTTAEEFWEVDKPGNFNNKGGRYMRAKAEDAEDIVAARQARKEPGRIPNYYLMPNGVEVKEIARYLVSNGGQAVQYIARATRIDGIIKGNPISDLEKARDMIDDEINRLKEEQ